MRITPHEILFCLGFDVPPEGIEINHKEVRLYVEAFHALGQTIDVSAIPESALVNLYNESTRLVAEAIDVTTIPDSILRDLNAGSKKLVLACMYEQAYAGRRLDPDVANWLSTLLNSNLSAINKQQKYGLANSGLYVLDDILSACALA